MNTLHTESNQAAKPRILHVIRTVGPSSMPWNDLYRFSRKCKPGRCFPPIKPCLTFRSVRIRKADCGGNQKIFLEANPLGLLYLVYRFSRYSRLKERNLLLHSHAPTLFWIPILVGVIFRNVALVANLHNEWSCMRWYQQVGLTLLACVSRKLICVSKSISKSIPSRLRYRLVARDAVEAIPNGIPSLEMDQSFPVAEFKRKRFPDVVVVARMVEQKNPELVLSIFHSLSCARNLVWYGDGALRNRVEARVKALGLENRVVLKGLRPRYEVTACLAESAVYLACSRWEGIGVANIEAAAMGAKVFMSDILPHREIAQELGVITYPLDDAQAWISAIDAALYEASTGDSGLDAALCARTARDVFDLEKKNDEYFRIYSDAMIRA